MSLFVKDADRCQPTLLPEYFSDYVAEDRGSVDTIEIGRFRPTVISAVGGIGGRSMAETFVVGQNPWAAYRTSSEDFDSDQGVVRKSGSLWVKGRPVLNLKRILTLASGGAGDASALASAAWLAAQHNAVGEGTLIAAAEAKEVGLFVAGAWGHSRLREMVFGSATRSFLDRRDGPRLLLAH